MDTTIFETIKKEIRNQTTIPYFGLGVFEGIMTKDGEAVPHDSDSLILAMNGGRAMAPRLMYEYSRAAMHLEQRRGVEYMTQLINHIYTKPFDPTPLHKAIVDMMPRYIIDTNRDTKLQEVLAYTPHCMIIGKARIMGNDYRYEVYEYDVENQKYFLVEEEVLETAEKILFKPMGTPLPNPSFIISDADYVDWLTEAMGGYAVPKVLKTYRKTKKYLFLGTSFDRDTDRMVANELSLDLEGGYVITDKELGKKEKKFIDKHNLEVIPMSLPEFIKAFV
ncbi:SIR2 family protein [Sulfuricurvum sp.]|uniref:SIR2 family protein n=1 Tax=Sulfuricurvum sp. TaxID=2025608 RepID=UPI002606F4D7|nr:SIR2 family protein [Sulfuricurvum sp.]MDD2838341.1 SIR2 family protein [Sulfuricurvum sp.]MDD3598238.1 SIR2 family protein [Sulfuricurvum sp.]MDD4883453.1 SIR2 family protein [Sulfuricurvum sp.]